MFRNTQVTKALVTKIDKVAKSAMDSYGRRLVEQEPQITDRFLGGCETSINNMRSGGVRWEAKTFTDRGYGSQESKFGADFLCSFSLNLATYSVSKGFLAQAKRVEPSDAFSAASFDEMKRQCEKMLKVSAASFVFLYSRQVGMQILPAISVCAARPCNPHELTCMPVSQFFTSHFECFIGDRGMAIPSSSGMDQLLKEMSLRAGLLIAGREEQMPDEAPHLNLR